MVGQGDTKSIMNSLRGANYGFQQPWNNGGKNNLFNQAKFQWREPLNGYHYTLIWEHQVEGNGMNKRAGYKTVMASKASRSAALPMYHSLKNSFNGCTTDEGPLMIHMNAMNSSFE